MWRLDNRTPYEAESTWGRDKDGVHQWIVAVKGTFDIKPDGSVTIADEQLKPLLAPEYIGKEGASSLRYDADFGADKPTTDVVLNAMAYAPEGRASSDFLVEFRIGEIRKVIRAVGDREWRPWPFNGPSAPQPAIQIPVIYERAYGGYNHSDPDPKHHRLDTRNPVGCGISTEPDQGETLAFPNFEYPSGNIATAGPAGFGSIDSFWSPRREFSGTYDREWKQYRRPLLPEDWDSRCLLCSPDDQRPNAFMHGGETVELTNLTPDGKLRFTLPKVYLTFRTRINSSAQEHHSHLSAVIIEPDYPRVIMVWVSTLLCRTDVDYLEETVIREKPYI